MGAKEDSDSDYSDNGASREDDQDLELQSSLNEQNDKRKKRKDTPLKVDGVVRKWIEHNITMFPSMELRFLYNRVISIFVPYVLLRMLLKI